MKLYTIGLACVLPGLLAAAAPAENLDAAAGTNAVVATDPRFGLLDGLDHRSAYYEEFFPQPLHTGCGDPEGNNYRSNESIWQRDCEWRGPQRRRLDCANFSDS